MFSSFIFKSYGRCGGRVFRLAFAESIGKVVILCRNGWKDWSGICHGSLEIRHTGVDAEAENHRSCELGSMGKSHSIYKNTRGLCTSELTCETGSETGVSTVGVASGIGVVFVRKIDVEFDQSTNGL